MGVDGFPGPQREIEGRFEFGTNKDWCSCFGLNFPAIAKFAIFSLRLILLRVRVDGFTGPWPESAVRLESDFYLSLKV